MEIDVQIPEPLWSVMQACETFCVAGCCGVDAFDISAEPLRQWSHANKVELLKLGIGQVEAMIKESSAENGYCSDQLNYCGGYLEWVEMLSKWRVAMEGALASAEGAA